METIPKNVLIELISTMPESLDVEQVIEQIIVLSKIERSKKQLSEGDLYTHEQVKNSYKKWLE